MLLRIEEMDDIAVVRQLLQAHEYWGMKRLAVDLVILNDRGASYVQDLQVALESLVRVGQSRPRIAGADNRGQVFVLRNDLVSSETRALLSSVARVELSARRGSLADQVARMQPTPALAPRAPRRAPQSGIAVATTDPEGARDLTQEFFNGQAASARRAGSTCSPTPASPHRCLDQRDRQPRLRFPGVRRRRRLHLGAQLA